MHDEAQRRVTARGYKSNDRSHVCSADADKLRDDVGWHCMHVMRTSAEGQGRTASFADDALLAAAISPRAAAKTSLTVSEGSTRASTHVRTMSSNAEPALDHKPLPPASATALITAPAALLFAVETDLSFRHLSAAFSASVCKAAKLRSELPRPSTTAATSLRAMHCIAGSEFLQRAHGMLKHMVSLTAWRCTWSMSPADLLHSYCHCPRQTADNLIAQTGAESCQAFQTT